ncbi:putative membrane protein [Bacillus phage BCP8-2]|uniref:Putative membrane protein n=1 Tax=Bacillus phage BCP8-2 TaxID=1129192 RepID=A0A0E3D9H7_9CAUD|nr:hypothetical protein BCP8-2_117 [Bacillus phage BCP8-2]AHJ87155.1 putative membrane protein [Bacillus phage BCP8-2]
MTDRTYAAVTDMGTDSNSFFDGTGGSMFQGIKSFFTGEPVNVIPNPIQEVIDWFGEFVTLIKGLPLNVGKMSADLMAWVYELCGDLILKTPLWLFSNEWFTNMTLLFSSVALGAVAVLTVIEAIKRMLSGVKDGKRPMVKAPMEFKTIIKRWALVAGLTTVVPFLFQKTFQLLNYISDLLIGMNGKTMATTALSETFGTLDIIALIAFDAVLIGTVIPVLWQNGRRFFDLLVLGITAPLALGAWVFDSKRHLFDQWFSSVKHLSMVQVYHSLFLLVLGWFIFGIPTPVDFTGTVIKLLVVIGGFARMQNPPRLIAKHLDQGGGIDEVVSKPLKGSKKKILSNFSFSKNVVTSPIRLWKKLKTK